LLLSVLPFIILLSAFADNRVDDDIAQEIGLSGQGARAVETLFRTPSVSFNLGIAVSLLLGLAGTIALARSVQGVYEQAFDQPRRSGPKTWPRCFAWVVCLAGLLIADAAVARPLGGGAAGRVAIGWVDFVILTFFFWWSIHFLLGGRVRWHKCWPSALATGLFWMGLGVFASIYFSSTIVSDSHLYGSIGVIFTLVTWFIAVGAVITLGAVAGVVWNDRRGRSPRNHSTDMRRSTS
jgi:membrane protein